MILRLTHSKKGKAVALLADMGTGKSMMTIAITGTLEADKGEKKCSWSVRNR